MNEKGNREIVVETFLESSTLGKPSTWRSPSQQSSAPEEDAGTSPNSKSSTPTKGSLEWLKARREWWKSSQHHKLVEYPCSEANDIQKAKQALDVLCAIQTGKVDDSTALPEVNSAGFTTESSSKSATREHQHRERLFAFYEKYNPSKLPTVDETLQKYRGREDELFRKLEAKYATDPYLPAAGTGPKCFMEFSTGGRVTFELFQDKVPFAAENFRSLCTGETGVSYRNCVVHRIVPNFCIQAGDYTKGDGTGGRSIFRTGSPANPKTDMWGNFEDETPFLRHDSVGLLSMANNGPNRNSSQFFITLRPLPHLNGKHVVFGRVTGGMDVVDKLSRLETNQKTQRPLETLRIINCGELLEAGMEDASDEKRTETTPVSHSSNATAPSVFPFTSPDTNESIFKSTSLPNSGSARFGMNQEDITRPIEKTTERKDSTNLGHRPKDDLAPSIGDPNLCAQISSCLQHLDTTDTIGSTVSKKGVAQKKENVHSSLDLKQTVDIVDNHGHPSTLFSGIPEVRSCCRIKLTIANLLLDDPLGLRLVDMVKGKEKALLQPISQVFAGAIKLNCRRHRSTKSMNRRAFVGSCSRNQYYLDSDPLFISFAINTVDGQKPL